MTSVQNSGTILVVDDEEALRGLVRDILRQQEFHVIEAADGAEALEVAAAYTEQLDLVLTDVIMPRVNGLVLAERLVQQRPGIGVLYMSGYMEQSLLLGRFPKSMLIQKPFTPKALVTAVQLALALMTKQ